MVLSVYRIIAIALYFMGVYIVTVSPHLIKKIIGINVMETAVFLFLISSGKNGAEISIMSMSFMPTAGTAAHPMLQFMVITGILISLGVTTLGLILAVKIFKTYHTLNINKLRS